MYNHLPAKMKEEIHTLGFGVKQLSIVVIDYYIDNIFCKQDDGSIIYDEYNLSTGANKSGYIDAFRDKECYAFQFAEALRLRYFFK
jgi:hypothetical protein